MPKISKNKLSDPAVRAAKFQDHSYKKHDGDGLFLLVNKSGRYWHFRFWLGVNDRGKPKERVMALGVYPDVSLSKARADRDKARTLLAQGIDPVAHRLEEHTRKKLAAANTFEAVARGACIFAGAAHPLAR